ITASGGWTRARGRSRPWRATGRRASAATAGPPPRPSSTARRASRSTARATSSLRSAARRASGVWTWGRGRPPPWRATGRREGTGTVTTVGGPGGLGYGGDGGPATAAELEHPVGVALDGAGNLFIAVGGAHDNGERVRRVDAGTGTITTVTGGSVPVGVALDG